MRDITGKIALITGAGSGIGAATATLLAQSGAKLVLCDINPENLAQIVEELGGAVVLSQVVDVADREAMAAFAERVHNEMAAVDILVNNAGVGLSGGLLDTSEEDWDWILSINLRGVIDGCRLFVPPMVRRGTGGHVVNLSSLLGVYGGPDVIGYVTAKFGVFGFSESLRAEMREHRIGVSTMCPGIVRTGIVRATRIRGMNDAEETRKQIDELYRRRNYTPDRVAKAILSAIRRNRAVVPVTPEAWAIYYLRRFTPWLTPVMDRILLRLEGN